MSESAPEQAKPGEADGVVGHCACEVDEVEEHFARGHGCGREEGGERVEGVEQEEALAHEGEGGDGECEAAAVAGEAGGEGEGEGEGEEVDVCPEGVLHAFLGRSAQGGHEKGGDPRETCLCLCCCRRPVRAPAARGRASPPRRRGRAGSLSAGRGPAGSGTRQRPRATAHRAQEPAASAAHPPTPRAASTRGSVAQTSWRAAATGDAT